MVSNNAKLLLPPSLINVACSVVSSVGSVASLVPAESCADQNADCEAFGISCCDVAEFTVDPFA